MGSTMDLTYGAMFIGARYSFQGVLTVQAYIYYESFPEDLRRLKSLVAVVWLLDAVHLVLICQACYHYLITSWGNNAALMLSTPELDLHLIFVGMATLLCQAFFLHRIWTFSRRNLPLTIVLSAACLATFGLQVALSAQIIIVPTVSYFSHHTGEVVAAFSVGGIVDVCIALVLVFYLQQGETHFDRTNFVVARVLQYTVATGLATSILAIACMAASSPIFWSAFSDTPQAMHFSLGRLYTNALLATLNSRRSLRQMPHTQPSAPSFSVMTTRVITTTTDDEYPLAYISPSPKDLPTTSMSH
ncbi:hypothetical protein C8R44DRAFT_741814 [Mycena epipterygia]|nr:hypothetical protein C8R44DRAFT_741814 [Mycena epipterygia]